MELPVIFFYFQTSILGMIWKLAKIINIIGLLIYETCSQLIHIYILCKKGETNNDNGVHFCQIVGLKLELSLWMPTPNKDVWYYSLWKERMSPRFLLFKTLVLSLIHEQANLCVRGISYFCLWNLSLHICVLYALKG